MKYLTFKLPFLFKGRNGLVDKTLVNTHNVMHGLGHLEGTLLKGRYMKSLSHNYATPPLLWYHNASI